MTNYPLVLASMNKCQHCVPRHQSTRPLALRRPVSRAVSEGFNSHRNTCYSSLVCTAKGELSVTQPSVLIVPGLGGSGPDHWQSLWEAAEPVFRRVVQRDWDRPELSEWLETLRRSIEGCAEAPVLVAHSLGCVLVAHWVKRHGYGGRGALLVSPSDVESPAHTPPATRGFSPIPLGRLPFPSIVVASTNDPYVGFDRAEHFAKSWGSRFVTVPRAGHINAASGLGEWGDGRKLLDELLHAT